MNKKTDVSFCLSQEEMFVLLYYLQVNEFPGLDVGDMSMLSKDQIKLILGVAERALIARGFLVSRSDNKAKLVDVIHSVMRTCANPYQTIWINCRYPEKAEETYYVHTTPNMSVLHSVPMKSIHQFLVLENKEALTRSAFSILNLGETSPLDCLAGQISEDALNNIRELTEANTEEDLAKELNANGLDHQTATCFAITLKKPVLNHTVVHIQHKAEGKSQVDIFSLLKGENGLWMLKPVEEGSTPDKFVALTPVTTEDVGKMLKTIFLSSEATPNG